MHRLFSIVLFINFLSLFVNALDLDTVTTVSASEQSAHLPRLSSRAMIFHDPYLYLTYWEGSGNYRPTNPSKIFLSAASTDTYLWAEPYQVDTLSSGRHPSIAIANDKLYIAWHDYRHASPDNYINNTEIYTNSASVSEHPSFAIADTRITSSYAEHNGDNGYVPCLFPMGDEMGIVWYDYFLNGLYSQVGFSSTENGSWSPVDISEMLICGGSQSEDYVLPSAVYLNDNIYMCFGGGYDHPNTLFAATYDQTQCNVYPIDLSLYNSYWDTPQIYLVDGKPVILAAGKGSENGTASINLVKLQLQSTPAYQTITLVPAQQLNSYAKLGFYNDKLYIAWMQGGKNVMLRSFSYPDCALLSEDLIASAASTIQGLAFQVKDDRELFFAWEAGDQIYFTRTLPPQTCVDHFQLYD